MADKGLTTADLDAMDDAQLSKELEKAKAELFNLRFAQAVGSLEDNGRMKTVRRNIARMNGSLATAPHLALRSD